MSIYYFIPIILIILYKVVKMNLPIKKVVKKANYIIYSIAYFNKELAILNEINKLRTNPLATDKEATKRAENRVVEIIEAYKEKGGISHFGFADDAGILLKLGADAIGEIIGFGYTSAKGIVNAWHHSKSHNKIMLDDNQNAVGIALKQYNNRFFFVAIFIKI